MSRGAQILRWALVLPVSAVGAVAIQAIGRAGNAIAGFNPDSLLWQAWSLTGEPAALSLAFIWCGATVAPDHKRHAAFALGALALVMAGAFLAIAIFQLNWRTCVASASAALGASLTLWAVHTGELLPQAPQE